MNDNINILLVDDRPENLLALEATLERPDVNLIEALSGNDALSILLEQDIALVLLDVQMPEMDGFEVARLMRGNDRTRHIPIIFVTAISKEERFVFEGYESGAVDYLFKPLDPDIVRSKVRVFVELARQKQAVVQKGEELKQANLALEEANQRMKDDLSAASQIQRELLPSQLPESPRLSFAWEYQPCDELAGDIFNVLPLDEQHFAIYLLDVSGHGVQAALLSSALSMVLTSVPGQSSVLRDEQPDGNGQRILPPSEVLQHLNRRFPAADHAWQFFTILYGIVDLEENTFRYASGGHPGPVLLTKTGEAEVLPVGGPAIGWIPNAEFTEQCIDLKSGERIFLYSDGVLEARTDANEQFEENRLMEVLQRSGDTPLQNSLRQLTAALQSWTGGPAEDDISILAMQIT